MRRVMHEPGQGRGCPAPAAASFHSRQPAAETRGAHMQTEADRGRRVALGMGLARRTHGAGVGRPPAGDFNCGTRWRPWPSRTRTGSSAGSGKEEFEQTLALVAGNGPAVPGDRRGGVGARRLPRASPTCRAGIRARFVRSRRAKAIGTVALNPRRSSASPCLEPPSAPGAAGFALGVAAHHRSEETHALGEPLQVALDCGEDRARATENTSGRGLQ